MSDVPVRSNVRRTRWFAIGAVAVALAAFLAIAVGGLGRNLVYYWGPSQLKAAGKKAIGASIRLGGMVVAGSVRTHPGSSNVEFEVTDGIDTVRVRSKGSPPQMFREGIGVVVEGTMTREGVFDSSRLMVSHGNDYKAPKDGSHPDIKELIRSTKGLEPSGDSQ
jgi:cytochrome c-type biogenesis protein CcmE